MVNMLAHSRVEDAPPATGHNKPPSSVDIFTSELTETYGADIAKIEPIAARVNAAPQKIENDEDLQLWTQIYLDASSLHKSLDAARLNEQRPMIAALKTVFGGTLERAERIMQFGRKISDDYNRARLARERAGREAEQKRLREEAEARNRDARIAAEFGDTGAVVEHAQAAASSQAEATRLQADVPKAADVARIRTEGGGLSTAATVWKFEITDYLKIDLNALRPIIDRKAVETAIGRIVRNQKGETRIEGVRVFEDVGTQFRR